MKYYWLTNNGLNIKETGVQFQCIKMAKMGGIQSDSIPFEGKIVWRFELPEPILQTRAKPTTYLSVVPIPSWFLVVKNYFVDFLKNSNLDEFQDWSLKVHHRNKIIDVYKLFYLPTTHQDQICDFSKSKFHIAKWSDWSFVGDTLSINDYNHYLSLKEILEEENLCIKTSEIMYDFSAIKLDLIRITRLPIGNGYYISERLKHAIEENGFTGMAFKEIEAVDKRIKVIY